MTQQLRRGLAGLCAAFTLLLAAGAAVPAASALASGVAATGAHDTVAVVAVQPALRTGLGLPEKVPSTGASLGAPPLDAQPVLDVVVDPAHRAPGQAPLGRASKDRSPPVQP